MEQIENSENRLNLAVESLSSFAGLHRSESPQAILQKETILSELLKLLECNPEDTQSFKILLGLALEENLKLNGSTDEVMLFCYDCFVDCVARALPAKLSHEFRTICSRHINNLPKY